jgi:hypothetical protein
MIYLFILFQWINFTFCADINATQYLAVYELFVAAGDDLPSGVIEVKKEEKRGVFDIKMFNNII